MSEKKCYIILLLICLLIIALQLYKGDNFFSPSQYSCRKCQEASVQFNASRIKKLVSFPFNNLVQNVDYILHTKWVQSVQMYLTQLTKKQVIVVSVDEVFLEKFLNWLSAIKLHTQIPFSNILILSMDGHVHKSLNKRGIFSILLDDDVIKPYVVLHRHVSSIWIKRCTVTRLLNHWGYDVIMLDLDAIVLNDPIPLFESFKNSDIIGSQGRYPVDLYHKWGVTLCMGVVMFRSTSAVETFWETTSMIKKFLQDDQIKINNVFQHLQIKWYSTAQCTDIDKCILSGTTTINLNVTLLSNDQVCYRRCLENNKEKLYYIWHKHAVRPKQADRAKYYNLWYLKDDWKDIWQTSPVLGEKLIDLLIMKN